MSKIVAQPVPYLSGASLDAYVWNIDGQVWDNVGETWISYHVTNLADIAIAMTEYNDSGVYAVDFPSAILSSNQPYIVYVKERIGASAAEDDPIVAQGGYLNKAYLDVNVAQLRGDSTAAITLEGFWDTLVSGTIDGGTPTTTSFQTTLTQATGYWNTCVLLFTGSAANAGVARRIAETGGYVQTNGVVTVERAFPVTPVDTDPFLILGVIE